MALALASFILYIIRKKRILFYFILVTGLETQIRPVKKTEIQTRPTKKIIHVN